MRFVCFFSLLAANRIKENSLNFNDSWQLQKGQSYLHLFIAADNHILMYKMYEFTADTNEYDLSLKLLVSGVAQCLRGGCEPCLCKAILPHLEAFSSNQPQVPRL